jgi:F-type H+-transporting ATPase subunit epsilon
MAELVGRIHLTILTPEKTLFDREVDAVVITAYDGEMGFLPRHAPLITTLGIGELQARAGGEQYRFATHGGFVRMEENRLLVLADVAESPEEIDAERAQESLARAREERRRGGGEEVSRALQRARTRLKILPRG